jgi:hypothetical protein
MAIVPSVQPGTMELDVLTGIGRSTGPAIDVSQVNFTKSSGPALVSNFPSRRLQLSGYDYIALQAGAGMATQAFTGMSLRVDKFIGESEVQGPVNVLASVRVRSQKGRTTALRLLLDDSMIYSDNGSIVVDQDLLAAANTDAYGGVLAGFYSDMVRFDIRSVSERPMVNGQPAQYVFVSGDLIGIANDSGLEVYFSENRNLDTVASRSGSFSGGTSGTYLLNELDPNDPEHLLTRLSGSWNDVSGVVSNIGTFAMLVFPSADPSASDQVIMFAKNGNGQVTDLYIGELNTSGGLFVAYPISELGSSSSSLIGGGIQDTSLGGTFSIDFGAKPAGFPDSGSYLRYLR